MSRKCCECKNSALPGCVPTPRALAGQLRGEPGWSPAPGRCKSASPRGNGAQDRVPLNAAKPHGSRRGCRLCRLRQPQGRARFCPALTLSRGKRGGGGELGPQRGARLSPGLQPCAGARASLPAAGPGRGSNIPLSFCPQKGQTLSLRPQENTEPESPRASRRLLQWQKSWRSCSCPERKWRLSREGLYTPSLSLRTLSWKSRAHPPKTHRGQGPGTPR